jgi:hypothetical protein
MTAETVQSHSTASELDEPVWSVISFERVEDRSLEYANAAKLLSELDGHGVAGLCIVSDNAAARIKTPK